jgi:hypothetical protein
MAKDDSSVSQLFFWAAEAELEFGKRGCWLHD